ncbi:BtpA/SgcQ family protein [Pseudosulfitobacter pseudonitzschiae]|uniref:BtpA/SgcQ family protein n=1 Tax=Pseudosulfitobacter pseudonitzschiae TaxID=1402135 RepID=UPI003B7B13E0
MNKFKIKFSDTNTVFGMLHLKGNSTDDVVARAIREARIMDEAGLHGLIVENYFGTVENVIDVLSALGDLGLKCKLGINILGGHGAAFELAQRFPIDFIQLDSVSGHLRPEDDAAFAADLLRLRGATEAAILGGVRFKYMPVLSGRSEAEDLDLGCDRCDAIVVTSDATGQETDLNKIFRFRQVLGDDMPILIGAGLTAANVRAGFDIADGGIVGSWLKDNHADHGDIDAGHTDTFMKAAQKNAEYNGCARC